MKDPVIILPYDPAWPGRFLELARPMRAALGEQALRIDHVGSTAVPDLDAKPIIDIQISVAELEPAEPYRTPLETLGYVFSPDNPELTKRYFREQPGQPRTHVHVRRAGSWAEQFTLLFRDYLRAHPKEAAIYAAAKHRLAEQHRADRAAYTDLKSQVIWEIMPLADRWSQEIGWQPGPSDF
jgi:GrpB-like predicted nucleotidyltransferase (UPF0157 family)